MRALAGGGCRRPPSCAEPFATPPHASTAMCAASPVAGVLELLLDHAQLGRLRSLQMLVLLGHDVAKSQSRARRAGRRRAPASPRRRLSRADRARGGRRADLPGIPFHNARWRPDSGGPHSRGDTGPNSTTDGVPKPVARCAIPVSPLHTALACGDDRGEVRKARGAGPVRRRGQAGSFHDRFRQRPFGRASGEHDRTTMDGFATRNGREPFGGPHTRPARCTCVDDRRAPQRFGWRRDALPIQPHIVRIGLDPGLLEQTAPSNPFVLAGAPARPGAALGCEAHEPVRSERFQARPALRPAAVQLDRDGGARQGGVDRCQRFRVDDLVDSADERDDACKDTGRADDRLALRNAGTCQPGFGVGPGVADRSDCSARPAISVLADRPWSVLRVGVIQRRSNLVRELDCVAGLERV